MTMRELLLDYKDKILENISSTFESCTDFQEIRINISAVFKCNYLGETCIFKYLLASSENLDESYSDYLSIHSESMLKLSSCLSFPKILEYKYIEIDGYTFLAVIEEYFPFDFTSGILEIYNQKKQNIIETCKWFLIELLGLYIKGHDFGFVSHRDLSFDNLMFNKNYELKMIDLGSAKSAYAETTVFHIMAPTKLFYSAPEYEQIHKTNKTNDDLVRAEIYTIGLLTLSLLNALHVRAFQENERQKCGIIIWLKENERLQLPEERLSEKNKIDYIYYVLINIFGGDETNKLFRLLRAMVDKSVSSRLQNYKFIVDYLGRD
ncbi:protein kinase domain-containing protein [Sinanaerobacter chloroacetimidivorans]|uniref:Protein kinase domain-containing protein n=1 Tax=Sinanaerobacter chloroacetimidivorans TaxID=2818044 RepID=A0A8J7W1Q1_9FIRM|nr:hypothetical protein [Sinanaerobacter chloroacetimidivorans]MBR0599247.1 hypothetical protein [Sinanaerobacter chloroacetimidivorans]